MVPVVGLLLGCLTSNLKQPGSTKLERRIICESDSNTMSNGIAIVKYQMNKAISFFILVTNLSRHTAPPPVVGDKHEQ